MKVDFVGKIDQTHNPTQDSQNSHPKGIPNFLKFEISLKNRVR